MQREIKLRPDHRRMAARRWDTRDADRLVAHYELERRLTDRLNAAPAQERLGLYSALYNELFESLSDHPQRTNELLAPAERVQRQLRDLDRLITPEAVFLEIGCGDAALTASVAPKVKQAYGLDITRGLLVDPLPANFTFLLSGGLDIPLPEQSVDLVYSNQLMEHLHPDDATAQLREISRVLKPGGRYYCVTPHRLTGPHDVSCYFDDESTCFHLREYDFASLAEVFRAAGFAETRFFASIKGRPFQLPAGLARAAERVLAALPIGLRRNYVHLDPIRSFLGVRALGLKPA